MQYEGLIVEAEKRGISVIEMKMRGTSKGYYSDGVIAIDSKIETDNEKKCVLIEELGHLKFTHGNILNTKKVMNVKHEKLARNWGYEKLIPLSSLILGFKTGIKTRYELSEFLNVTEEFLDHTLQHYREKYGVFCNVDNYLIFFEPTLIVVELFT